MVWMTSPTAESLMIRILRNSRVRSAATSAADASRGSGPEFSANRRRPEREAVASAASSRYRPEIGNSVDPRRFFRRALQHCQHPLERRGNVVPQHSDAPVAFRSHPVELNDPALAGKRLVPVPGAIGALE